MGFFLEKPRVPFGWRHFHTVLIGSTASLYMNIKAEHEKNSIVLRSEMK
jgi:hypothetical protein